MIYWVEHSFSAINLPFLRNIYEVNGSLHATVWRRVLISDFLFREPLYQSLILVYCWHSEDTSIFLKVRDFARNHGKDLLQSNVLLYAIVMQDECHASKH